MAEDRGEHDAERCCPGPPVNDEDDIDWEAMDDRGEDFDLIIAYLQGKLDEEQVAAIKARFTTDNAFFEMAAPMIFAWTVTTDPKDIPQIPREELERRWDEFTKRAGFIHQQKKKS